MLSLFLIIPLACAIACLLTRQRLGLQRFMGLGCFVGTSLSAAYLLHIVSQDGYVTMATGNWPVSIGIVLVSDVFSALMLLTTNIVGGIVIWFGATDLPERLQRRQFYPVVCFLMVGINGSFLTGDLFNLYVWFEIMLLSSFILLSLGRKAEQLEGAIKYVLLNLFASFLFLVGIGLVYAKVGSLNLAAIAMTITQHDTGNVATISGIILLVAFGFKAALFPFFFWLPASYHTAHTTITALFGALLTKVGVYALFRVFTLVYSEQHAQLKPIFGFLAISTMVIGVLCAAAQYEIKRILSVHIVSQIGYMILGLVLFTPLAIAGAIFYIIHNIVIKTTLFLIAGSIDHLKGSTYLKHIGGLFSSHMGLSVIFAITAFSLAGLPPFSGFWAKLFLLHATVKVEDLWWMLPALSVSVVTLYSMVKIWAEGFWAADPQDNPDNYDSAPPKALFSPRIGAGRYAPVIALATIGLALGLSGEWVFNLSQQAADQLTNPQAYIDAVLGANTP